MIVFQSQYQSLAHVFSLHGSRVLLRRFWSKNNTELDLKINNFTSAPGQKQSIYPLSANEVKNNCCCFLKGLSKYRRMAFSFLELPFLVLEIQYFICFCIMQMRKVMTS